MKEPQEHINLTFSCQEDIESMAKTNDGAFCSACQKEVIDFTKMSIAEIKETRKLESEICGKFRIEQLEPHLRPIEAPRMKSIAFLSTLLLSLNFNSASAQSTVDPKVEQSHGASNAPNLTPSEVEEKTESGQHISMSRASVSEEPVISDRELRKLNREHQKKWFWSKRFPFLHKKRRHLSGRFL
ncbi:MAG: hypothetical protein AB8B56_13290 [Crocinitomicaceae bacterium]